MIGILGKGCSVFLLLFRPVGLYSRFWSFRGSPDGPCECVSSFFPTDHTHKTCRANAPFTHCYSASCRRTSLPSPPAPRTRSGEGSGRGLHKLLPQNSSWPRVFSLAFQTLARDRLLNAHPAALGGELPPGRRLPGDAACEGSTAGARAHVRPTDFRSTCRTACTRTDRDEDLR